VNLHVEVPEKGVAQLTGALHSENLRDRLLEVVKVVPGISKVNSDVAIIIPSSAEW